MKLITHIFQTAVEEKRRADDPTEGIKLHRVGAHAVDEDKIPTLHEVDIIAKQISPQYRLTCTCRQGPGCASVRPWPSPPTAAERTSCGCAGK
jgi:hypothetical protein